MYVTINIITCMSVAREQLGKHVPERKNSWPTTGKELSIAKQRTCKQTSVGRVTTSSSTIEALFSMWSVRRLYNEVCRITPAVQFSPAVELRGEFKAIERLVRTAVQL
jgi:hypothetical protein